MLKTYVNRIIKTPTSFRHSEDGQTRVTETCRGFNDVIYKNF